MQKPGLLSRLRSMIGGESKSAISRSDLLLDLLGNASAKSGVAVTWETALQAASAIACARVIAEGIAQVPLKLYLRRADGGSDAATDHPLYNVLHASPAPGITSFEWRETMGLLLAMQNRAYCLINRSTPLRGPARVELQPLTPQQVVAKRQDDWSMVLCLADALDRSHSQRIKSIQLRPDGGRLNILTSGIEDTTIEQIAINSKCDIFREIYGYDVVLAQP